MKSRLAMCLVVVLALPSLAIPLSALGQHDERRARSDRALQPAARRRGSTFVAISLAGAGTSRNVSGAIESPRRCLSRRTIEIVRSGLPIARTKTDFDGGWV